MLHERDVKCLSSASACTASSPLRAWNRVLPLSRVAMGPEQQGRRR